MNQWKSLHALHRVDVLPGMVLPLNRRLESSMVLLQFDPLTLDHLLQWISLTVISLISIFMTLIP